VFDSGESNEAQVVDAGGGSLACGSTGTCSTSRPAVPDGTGMDALGSLDRLDLTGMTSGELLDVLKGLDRQAAWLAAKAHRVMARLSEQLVRQFQADPMTRAEDYPLMIAEIGAATRQSDVRVGKRWSTAHQLTRVVTETLATLQAGEISDYQAQLISEATFSLDPEDAVEVEARVLPKASRQTPAQLARSLRSAIIKIDPDAANQRAKRAVKDRNVWTRPLPDGMAELGATGPAAAIHALFGALDARAEKPRLAGDTRRIGARRFDALQDAVLGGHPNATSSHPTATHVAPGSSAPDSAAPDNVAPDNVAPDNAAPDNAAPDNAAPDNAAPDNAAPDNAAPDNAAPDNVARNYVPMGPGFLGDGGPPLAAIVHITMDLPTLLGLRDNPAQLAGYGPLPAALARDLAASNPWRRLITDPLTGHLLDAGRRSYRPSAALADYIRSRDKTCRFPGCSRSAWKTDIDHRIRYSRGGRTDRNNLAPLCERHHQLKHHGWTYRFIVNGCDTTTGYPLDPKAAGDPDDVQQIIWTSPTGRTYTTWPDLGDDTDPLRPPPNLHPDDQHDWANDRLPGTTAANKISGR
jgi:hypothetical protein